MRLIEIAIGVILLGGAAWTVVRTYKGRGLSSFLVTIVNDMLSEITERLCVLQHRPLLSELLYDRTSLTREERKAIE